MTMTIDLEVFATGNEAERVGDLTTIDRHCLLEPGDGRIQIGIEVSIGCQCYMDGSGVIIIGPRVRIGAGVKILSKEWQPGEHGVADGREVHARIVIEEGCVVEAGAIIMPGVMLGRNSLVGAGAVVAGGVYPEGSLIVPPAADTLRREVEPERTPEPSAGDAEGEDPEMPPVMGDQTG